MKKCLDCGKIKSRKGSYCKKCGYKHRVRPTGMKYVLVKENPTSFRKGNKPWNTGTDGVMVAWNKGIKGLHLSPKTEFKKGQKAWNEGLPHMQDEKHPKWKGDDVGYLALHSWVQRKLGKPNKCIKCGTIKAKRFEWANISGKYMRDLSDWKRLCSKCHANEHRNWEARWHVT